MLKLIILFFSLFIGFVYQVPSSNYQVKGNNQQSALSFEQSAIGSHTSYLKPPTSETPHTSSPCFVWGINGHPVTQKDYAQPTWDDQIKLLTDLNINCYRMDVLLNAEGSIKNESAFKAFADKLAENKITPFAVLSIGGINAGAKENIYNASFNQGKRFANLYGKKTPVIEVGNEYDNKILLKGPYDGTKKSHYDEAKTDVLMNKLKGFIDGVKSVEPGIKISLSVGWVHYYYLQLLQDYKIDYDIIGYHWYSNMGNIFSVKGYGNVLQTVSSRFKKPIWMTEFNFRNGTQGSKYELQKKYIQNHGLEIVKNSAISGFFIYELLDEPAFKLRKPTEAYYGLAYIDSTGTLTKKSAYYTYKNIIKEQKNSSPPCENL